jgi:hypothetical protein
MFNQYFGNYLLEKNILKPEDLRKVLEQQKSVKVKLGVLAIDTGYMNAAQVSRIHGLQAVKDRRFGELAVEEGFLTPAQLDELLRAQEKSNTLLGQALIEKGLFTYEKYEEVLRQYRQDANLTEDELQALQRNDITKITELLLKSLSGGQNRLIRDYLELFIRNVVRFIDDDVRLEPAVETASYPFDYLVTQRIEGEYDFFSGFAAPESVLAQFASIYAEEELEEMNEYAEDALAEFLNCQNGLFLSNLSHQGADWALYLAEVKRDAILNPADRLYVVPCYLSFGKVDFLFTDGQPGFIPKKIVNIQRSYNELQY